MWEDTVKGGAFMQGQHCSFSSTRNEWIWYGIIYMLAAVCLQVDDHCALLRTPQCAPASDAGPEALAYRR
jgi:hypothetical protein